MTQIKETLETNNKFGPFNQAFQLELAPLTVFIGPQGTGKSLISQFLYFFRDIEYLLANFMDRTTSKEMVVKKIIEAIRAGEKSEQAFAPLIFDNVHIAYSQRQTEKIERTISFLKKRYTINPIFDFKKEIEEWLVEFRKPGAAGQVKNNALFFPAERTFVSHVINSAPSLLGNSALSLATRHLIDFLSVEVANAQFEFAL
jgi:SpoVK/Ycf46/Vps4 family AAA+-type ATPase